MVLYTPIYGIPTPEMSDPPDGVGQIEDMALAVEAAVDVPTVQTWVPTWTSSGSPSPANPSTLTGRYTIHQGWCDFSFVMQMSGSTTGGAGQWRFRMPRVAAGHLLEQVVDGKLWEPQVGQFPLQGLIFGGTDQLWCYAVIGGTSMNYGALQQINPTSTPGTQIPINSPGPLQAGGNVVYTGRYLIA